MKRVILGAVLLIMLLPSFSVKALLIDYTIIDNAKYFSELVRCVEAEATDGTFEQKMNVASCILNRRDSDSWPSTIHGVIFQKGQFSVISDKRYYKVKIQKSTIEACWEVIMHGKLHKCMFFCTPAAGKSSLYFKSKGVVFNDGMHNYYY